VDFSYSGKQLRLISQVKVFMDDLVVPAVPTYEAQLTQERWRLPPVAEELKAKAKAAGLWNLFLPRPKVTVMPRTRRADQSRIRALAEQMGRVIWASEVFNCSAPDSGNMEVLHRYGTAEQQRRWLKPLLEGEIRWPSR